MSFLDKFFQKKQEHELNEMSDIKSSIKQVALALEKVIDPETGVSIVDLGLIYSIALDDSKALIKMTMTTPSCPVVGLLMDLAKENIESLSGVSSVEIDLIWEPKWKPDMMSKSAKKQLGW